MCNKNNICFMAFFQDRPCKPVPECHYSKDDGVGGNSYNFKTCKAPVKSSTATYQHSTFYMPNAISVTHPALSVL